MKTKKSRGKPTPNKLTQEAKQLKYLSKLVKLQLPQNSPDKLYPKVTDYCHTLLNSRLFSDQFKKIDNYTSYIQQLLLQNDKKNPFLTGKDIEQRYKKVI